jgi:hypothetical protein
MRRLRAEGLTYKAIGEYIGCTECTVRYHLTERRRNYILGRYKSFRAGASLALALIASTFWHDPVSAHNFYSYECCSDKDCGPIPFERVRVTPDGYVITFPTGRVEVIPYGDKRIRDTPPADPAQQYHLCTVAGRMDGMILCFYVPQGGA